MLTAARLTLISPIETNDWIIEKCISWYVRVEVFCFPFSLRDKSSASGRGISLEMSGFGVEACACWS